jgi:hypothetical protein
MPISVRVINDSDNVMVNAIDYNGSAAIYVSVASAATNSVIVPSISSTATGYLSVATGAFNGTGVITGTVNSVIVPSGTILSTSTVSGTFTTYRNRIYYDYCSYVGGWACNPDSTNIIKKYKKQIVPKRTKSSIKRALKLMFNMGFEEEARIFLNGDSIEVSHPDSEFKFVITKYNNSLIHRTEYPGCSTPYQLELYTKTNVFIAKLCIYMEGTPVLDQVLGVALFIKSGDESKILRKANWLSLSNNMELREQLALSYPDLTSKLRITTRYHDHDDCDNATGVLCTPEASQSGITINSTSGIMYSNIDAVSP